MRKIGLTLATATLAFGTLSSGTLVFAGTVLAAPAALQDRAMPEFQAVQWYNAPPMEKADLAGRAVFLEVFRTW